MPKFIINKYLQDTPQVGYDGTDFVAAGLALLLDQSTPQTIQNGLPISEDGWGVGDGTATLTQNLAGNLVLSDGITGAKTLAQLAAGGGGVTDHNALNNLNWASAAHTFDTDLEIGAYSFISTEISTPANPASNKMKVYAKDVAGVTKLHTLDSAGTETELGSGGGATDLPELSDVDDALAYTDHYVFQADGSQYTGSTYSHTWLDDIGSNTHAEVDSHIANVGLHNTAKTPDSVLFVGADGYPAQDNTNFTWDDTNDQLQIGPDTVYTGQANVPLTVSATYDYGWVKFGLRNASASPYAMTIASFCADNSGGSLAEFRMLAVGCVSSTCANPYFPFLKPNDSFVSALGGDLFVGPIFPTFKLHFATGGLTVDEIRMTVQDDQVHVLANEEAESCPALEAANWTATNGFSAGSAQIVCVNDVDDSTIEPSAATWVSAGNTYHVELTASAATGTIGYTIGGTSGSAITATTLDEYVTASTTGKFIITATAGATCTITSISIRELVDDTGNLVVDGDIYLGSKLSTLTGYGILSAAGEGIATFDQIPLLPAVDPTTDNQAVRKAYVDTVAQGLFPAVNCRAATTVHGTLATAYENGDTIDTVVLATGDIILIKNQNDSVENGLYEVNASGAPSRIAPYETGDTMYRGTYTGIEEGSTNLRTNWVVYSPDAVIDTDEILWRQTFISQTYTGSNGIQVVGFDIQTDLSDTNPALEVSDGGLRAKVNDTSIERTASGLALMLNASDPGLELSSGLRAKVDNSTIERGASGLQVKDDGITNAKIGETITVANGGTALTSLGTANQILGVDSGATALEYKTLTEGSNVTITHTAGDVTISANVSGTADYFYTSCVFHSHLSSNYVWTNMPAAETALAIYKRANLTGAVQYRICCHQAVAGYAGADLNLEYSTNGSTWYDCDTAGAGELDVGTGTGLKTGAWTNLVAGAKQDVRLRLVGKDGDGIVDPGWREIWVELKYNASIVDLVSSDTVDKEVTIHSHPASALVWTNMPAAVTEFISVYGRQKADLSNCTHYRIYVSQSVAGYAGADLNLQYSLDGTTWASADNVAEAGELDVGTGTGAKTGAWAALKDAAKSDVFLRLVGKDGNGVVDPAWRQVKVQFREHTYGQGVTGSDTQVLFNDSGATGADSRLTYNKTTNTFSVLGAATVTGGIQFGDTATEYWVTEVLDLGAGSSLPMLAAVGTGFYRYGAVKNALVIPGVDIIPNLTFTDATYTNTGTLAFDRTLSEFYFDKTVRFQAATKQIGIYDSNYTYYTYLQGGAQGGDITYILPTALPIGNRVLQSTSGGTLSWTNSIILGDGTNTEQQIITVDMGGGVNNPYILYDNDFFASGWSGWQWTKPTGKSGLASLSLDDESAVAVVSNALNKMVLVALENSTDFTTDGSGWLMFKDAGSTDNLIFAHVNFATDVTSSTFTIYPTGAMGFNLAVDYTGLVAVYNFHDTSNGLTAATGLQTFLQAICEVNQSGSANYQIFNVTSQPTGVGSGDKFLVTFTRNSDNLWVFSDSANPYLKQRGYITANTNYKHIQWQIDDTDDLFHLTREDEYLLGFEIDMPLLLISTPLAWALGAEFDARAGIRSYISETADYFTGANDFSALCIGMSMELTKTGDIDGYGTGCLDAGLAHRFYEQSNCVYKGANDVSSYNAGVYGGMSNNCDINATGKTLTSVNLGFFSDCVFYGASTSGTHNAYNVLMMGILETDAHVVTTGTVKNIMLYAYDNAQLGNMFVPKVGDENYVLLNETDYPITMRSDAAKLQFGAGDDFEMYWDGTNQVLDPTLVTEGGVQIITDANTDLVTDALTIDLDIVFEGLSITLPMITGNSYSNMPETLPFPYAVGVWDRFAIIDKTDNGFSEILFANELFTSSSSLAASHDDSCFYVNWDWNPDEDNEYSLGNITNRWKDIYTSGALYEGITTVTGTYSVLSTDRNIVCNSSSDFTVTLPTAVVGQVFYIKNIGEGVVTVDGDGSDTIDGDTTQSLNQWEGFEVQCYEANKWIVK